VLVVLRRILTWDPPLPVAVLALFVIVCVVSLAIEGAVTWSAVLLAVVCSGAQWGRKRRHSQARAGATRSEG
jgi:hypothetical protein